ncbi:hypothetical protein B0I21_103216 [Sphingobacterium paludis]|uniref:Uncharacterized protein n=1 Tax=Sphingobacterium paludis TaxID=1476465 RepID=A0A4R7D2R9_9SPHI|nr:hypothetical protein B0I21_103216 [Sphingobacterium paludis]
MEKKLVLVILDQLLNADDITENRKEALKIVRDEVAKSGNRISKEKMMDYAIRISNILATIWKFLE